jgi:phospholipid/cholesterol/gamma-HCH transport system substrate-binding protein
MKRIYNNYLLVGIFTIIIGGIFIFMLLKMSGQNKNTDTYYSYFNNVTGLGYGNPVYYEGYRVGQVEKITPQSADGKLMFKTEYTIISGWKVPLDSITKIEASGLLSDMSLSIRAGSDANFLSPDSEIKGIIGDDIMATMSNLAKEFETMNKEKISPLLELVYERTDTLTKSLETQIPEILTSIDLLVKDLSTLVKSADKLLSQENIDGVGHIITNVEELSNQLSSVGKMAESSISNVNELIGSGKKLIESSDKKVATLLDISIKMMQDFSLKAETIANEIESATMNMNEATDIIRENPSSLIFSKKSKVADEDL